jgi:hypothetical protein
MRRFRMATLAASALVLSIGFGPASALSPIGGATDPVEILHKVDSGDHSRNARNRDHDPRTEFRSGDRGGDRRHHGGRGVDFDIYVGPSYGYVSDCEWLRRRAVATGSSYWWRRYRACID